MPIIPIFYFQLCLLFIGWAVQISRAQIAGAYSSSIKLELYFWAQVLEIFSHSKQWSKQW